TLYFFECNYPHSTFSFNDPPTTEIYTLSLHDALPIFRRKRRKRSTRKLPRLIRNLCGRTQKMQKLSSTWGWPTTSSPNLTKPPKDRKSTRLNSSHVAISYAVFCLKKKNKAQETSCRVP